MGVRIPTVGCVEVAWNQDTTLEVTLGAHLLRPMRSWPRRWTPRQCLGGDSNESPAPRQAWTVAPPLPIRFTARTAPASSLRPMWFAGFEWERVPQKNHITG